MARVVLAERAWADAVGEGDIELEGLVDNAPGPRAKPRNLRRRLVAGLALGAAGLCAVALKRGLAPCVPTGVGSDIVTLVQVMSPEEIIGLSGLGEKPDALLGWLAAANGAGEALKGNAGGQTSAALAQAANEAIHSALQGGDPKAAEKLAVKLMQQAAERATQKRKGLSELVKTVNASTVAKKVEALKKLSEVKFGKSVSQQTSDATCVFNVLGITTSVATLSANINDVSKTCEGVAFEKLLNSKVNETHAKVCAVNLAAMAAGFASISTSLATASDECAQTMIPNVDAMCSAAITGMMTASAAFGGSFTLIAAACKKTGWYGRIPSYITPSSVGSNELWHSENAKVNDASAVAHRRRLEDEAEDEEEEVGYGAPAAPVRKLLFGGGKGALATQCATEILNIGWGLVDFALAINSMANPEMKPACPPKNLKGGTRLKGPVYKIKEQLCTVDVGSTLVAFFSVVTMAQLVAVTCTDTIKLGPICGSGITGSFAAASGIVKTAAGLALACDLAQRPVIHDLITMARNLDRKLGLPITTMMEHGNAFGAAAAVGARRLSSEDRIAELQRKYKTPAEAWKAMGYDLEDKNAPWRQLADSDAAPIPDEYLQAIVDEVQAPARPAAAAQEAGLFGQRTCEA